MLTLVSVCSEYVWTVGRQNRAKKKKNRFSNKKGYVWTGLGWQLTPFILYTLCMEQ